MRTKFNGILTGRKVPDFFPDERSRLSFESYRRHDSKDRGPIPDGNRFSGKKILVAGEGEWICNLLHRKLAWLDPSSGLLFAPGVEEAVRRVRKRDPNLVVVYRRSIDEYALRLALSIYGARSGLPLVLVTASSSKTNVKFLKMLKQAFWIVDGAESRRMLPELVETFLEEKSSGFIAKMSVESVLQVLSMESKSCRIKVKNEKGEAGVMLLNDGEIRQSFCKGLSGTEAAVEAISWTGTDIVLFEGCGTVENRLGSSINSLVLEGCRLRDERSGSGRPAGTGDEEAALAVEAKTLLSSGKCDAFPGTREDKITSRKLSRDAEAVVSALARFVSRIEGVKAFLIALDDGTVLAERRPASADAGSIPDEILVDVQFRSASKEFMRLRSHVVPWGKKSDLAVYSLPPLNVVVEIETGSNIDAYFEILKPLIKRASFRFRFDSSDNGSTVVF